MVGGITVGAEQGEVFDVGAGLHLFAVDGIGKADDLACVAGDAEAEGEGLSGSGAAVAFFAGEFAHAGIEEPGSLHSGSFALSCVGGRKVAVGEFLLEYR